MSVAHVNVKPKTLRSIWEAKMPVDVFDERGLSRRKNLRKRGDMALLRVIGGILEVFFWIFLLIGVIVTIGVMFKFPVVGVFLLACAIAGVIAGVQRVRGH